MLDNKRKKKAVLIIMLQSVFFDIIWVRSIGCKIDLRNLLLVINRTGAAAWPACQKLADTFTVKHNLTFHANCLKRGINLHQFAWNVKCCLLGKIKKDISKYGMIKLLHRALAHLFDACEKFNTVALKGQGFSQTLQDVFSLLLICLTLKYFICGILIKMMLGFKV